MDAVKLTRRATKLSSRYHWLAGIFIAAAVAGGEPMKTESRGPFLHNIPLHDAAGRVVSPPPVLGEDGKMAEPKGPPYSVEMTCGKCHDYDTIRQGWHFNAGNGAVKPGRPGEPWIWTDSATRTQIPLSYRGWKGTFKPSDLGLSDYDFLTNFSRHFPGGGAGSPDDINGADAKMGRMQITGKLEIDCLICHASGGDYNHEGRFTALKGEDFSWAPTIAAGLGTFGSFRSAGAIANQWHPGRAVTTNLPAIKYNRARFDADNNVTFHVTRRASPDNCYYCHTSQKELEDSRWHSDGDIHMRAGMNCADCHRHGLDHALVRGYEGESRDRTITTNAIGVRVRLLQRNDAGLKEAEALAAARRQLESEASVVDTLTCSGCHDSGRMGSPKPVHKGLPAIHFTKLTCTACHSGPAAGPQPEIVHTSMAHKLGLPLAARGGNMAPIIVEPVFLRDGNGKIAPYKMMWPSYWARLKDGKLTPMPPAEAAKSAGLPRQSTEEAQLDPFNSKPLTSAQIQDALQALAGDTARGEPVFLAAGKMYRVEKGKLLAEENEAAAPYSWALGHDVRPARQALGAKGCADCHSTDSPEFFGTVLARGPVEPGQGVSKAMCDMRGDAGTKTWAEAFALAFIFRPWLKVTIFAAGFVVLAVLVLYAMRGLGAMIAGIASKKSGT
jgi:hypothetical protein